MENCIFSNNPNDVKDYDRLYFGNEFCEKNIMDEKKYISAITQCQTNGKKITIVTPYVTDYGIQKLKPILKKISETYPYTEIVVNDLGVYNLIKNLKLKPILGRLLTKQRRGPDIINIIETLPKGAIDFVKSSMANNNLNISFLKKLNIDHIELDNILQIPSITQLKTSLYYPYVYITTARKCKSQLSSHKHKDRLRITCVADCKEMTLSNKNMPVDLILKGNTIFYKNKQLPKIQFERLIKIKEIIL